jgi:polysaccharide export outer membrane protein
MIRVVFPKSRWILSATLMIAAGAAPLFAPRVAWAQTFRLGPDDVIAVQVANHPEMSAPEIAVGANGKIALPLVGSLSVVGKSLAQTQVAITQAMRSQLRSPQVTVALVRTRPRQVIALGAVVRPGPIDVQPGWRVTEVLAAVGGLSQPVEDVSATLTRAKMAPMPLNLAQIFQSPQNTANVRLKAGDVINVVPVPVSRVTVSGDVVTPSQVTLRRAPRVLDAIVAAGGLKAKPEEMRGTLLRGKTTKIGLNLPALFTDRASSANVPLKDGDLLSFETIQTNISVVSFDNLVKMPGNYQIPGDVRTLRAILTAGGLTVPATNVVTSIRRGSEILPVDLERAVYDPTKDLPLREGDVLLLTHPEGPQVTLTGAVASPGPLRVKTGSTLLDAVVAAGGLTFKPDQVRLTILRTLANGKQITLSVDPVALFDLRDLGQNVVLQNGDLIVVNQGAISQTVFVSGEVVTPGAFEINPKDSLPEVILRAGGPTKLAALRRVSIARRDGTTQTVDVSESLVANAEKIEIPLQAGDIINVPRNENRVLVMNAVTTPGYYPIPENGSLSIGDAILAAGGAVQGAKMKEVALLRRTPAGVDKQIISLAAVKNGVMTLDIPLQNGDVVYVPEGRVGPNALKSALQTLGSFGAILRFGSIF